MYQIFDIVVECYLPLPELPKAEYGSPSLSITQASKSQYGLVNPGWQNHWYSVGKKIAISSTQTEQGDYLMRFIDLADFQISSTLDAVVVHPAPDVAPNTIRHLLLDQLIPRILGQQGRLLLHGSAISFENDSGIAFLGSSGWGKSTIASSFAQNGFSLITDDCLLLDRDLDEAICIPSYSGSRLFPDSINALHTQVPDFSPVSQYSEKKRLLMNTPPHRFTSRTISTIFLLNDPSDQDLANEIGIEPIKGTTSIMTLIKRTFLLDVNDLEIAAKLFKCAGQILSSGLSIYSLSYPRNYDKLTDLRKEILSTINTQKGTAKKATF